jgi:hypothetical protein
LQAGGYALLVTRNFQLDDGADPPVAAGALLLRTDGGRLVGSGLRAAGEPLWVEDQAGRVVTRWGGYPLDLAPGQSVSRVSPVACDLAASFEPTRSGRSTPGSG